MQSRVMVLTLLSAIALVMVIPSASVAQDMQATQCALTPSVLDPSGSQEYLYAGAGEGYPMVYPGPQANTEWLFTQQAILDTECYSFGQNDFTLDVEFNFQRLEQGVWTDLDSDPLVCSVVSQGDPTTGVWAARLQVPGPGCWGQSNFVGDLQRPPTQYRVHISLQTAGVDVPTSIEADSLPWVSA